MTKRPIEIKVRLNQKEADLLNRRVKNSRLSRETYLRQLINGYLPKEAPPPDYYAMMKELHGIGNNLNQIARLAHELKVVDEKRLDSALKELSTATNKIMEATILPQPIKDLPNSENLEERRDTQ